MKEKPKIEQLSSYKEVPFPDENIVHEDENVVVYKDGFPVTEGHLLFIPKSREQRANITICFEYAYDWGVRGIRDYKWEGFNVGINQNECAGQSILWPHVHMIPRRKGDTPNPKGGVRHVIPLKGNYDDTTEDGWENEGGMAFLPVIDDNSSREELDNWKERYKGYREYKNEEKSVPAPCSRTALVRDRYIDEIKTEMKGKRQGRSWDKIDDITWDKVVKRMKDKEKKRRENDNK